MDFIKSYDIDFGSINKVDLLVKMNVISTTQMSVSFISNYSISSDIGVDTGSD